MVSKIRIRNVAMLRAIILSSIRPFSVLGMLGFVGSHESCRVRVIKFSDVNRSWKKA